MSAVVERFPDAVVVRLDGTLDSRNAAGILALLEDAAQGAARLVLDLAGLEYMSSTGLRILLLLDRGARRDSRSFVVAGARAEIQEILVATGMLDHLHTAPSVEQARQPVVSS